MENNQIKTVGDLLSFLNENFKDRSETPFELYYMDIYGSEHIRAVKEQNFVFENGICKFKIGY